MHENAWRQLLAALADDRARGIYARIVLNQPVDEALAALPGKKAKRIVDALTAAGLISPTPDGFAVVPDVFARALASAGGSSRRDGVDRFLEAGRLVTFPSRAADRRALLEHVATRVLAAGDIVSEAEINARLAEVTDDVAGLRRALVDEGLVARTSDGSAYSVA